MAVFEKVKDVVVEELGVSEDQVTPEANFTEDLGADSLHLVEVILRLEEVFEIEIPDEDAEKVNTVADAVQYVEEKLGQKGV
jgi:acyl carrier protein